MNQFWFYNESLDGKGYMFQNNPKRKWETQKNISLATKKSTGMISYMEHFLRQILFALSLHLV